jgi:hypothetical protein
LGAGTSNSSRIADRGRTVSWNDKHDRILNSVDILRYGPGMRTLVAFAHARTLIKTIRTAYEVTFGPIREKPPKNTSTGTDNRVRRNGVSAATHTRCERNIDLTPIRTIAEWSQVPGSGSMPTKRT